MQKKAPTLGNILVIILFVLSCFGLLMFLWESFGGPLPLIAIAWLVRRPEQDSAWQLPLFMGGFGVVIWLIAAYGHVVKAALEWSSGSSVALVILQIVAAQLLLFALFPPGPGPA